MLISEIILPLHYLDASDDIETLLRHVRASCVDVASSRNLISQLEAKALLPFSDKSPFYFLFLAYAYHTIPDWFRAKDSAERAETQFVRTHQKRNRAICNWLLGLLYCVYEDFDNAEVKINEARNAIQILQKDITHLGEYEIPAREYKYPEIAKSIGESYVELKNQVSSQISFKQTGLALDFHLFTRLIGQLSIPEELVSLEEWIQDILVFNPTDVPDDGSFVKDLLNFSPSSANESALIKILLAHRFNLGDYKKQQRGIESEEYAQQAIELFPDESLNKFIAEGYLSLVHYNSNAEGTGRAKLDDAFWKLDRAQKEYEKNNYIENCIEIQNLQNDLLTWIFPFQFGEADQHTQSSRWSVGNLVGLRNLAKSSPQRKFIPKKPFTKISKSESSHMDSSTEKTPEPEPTSPIKYRRNEIASLLPLLVGNKNDRPQRRKQTPKTPRIPPTQGKNSGEENESDVQLIVVPVDLKALEKTQINDSPVSGDLFEKLANYDEEYYRRKGDNSQLASDQKATRRHHIIIPSFPIRGQATASPRGEALLPSIDGSQARMAPPVDETMILHIQNHSYLVRLLDGVQAIHGGAQTHDWFQVDGNSMDLARPIPIEDQDYVLFDKSPCSLQSCEGKIVLASVRDANIDPTRLMIKKFVVINPEQHPEFNDTARFLLSESRSKHKAIELTKEFRIEGKVVAIAKQING